MDDVQVARRWRSASISDVGLARAVNEDACLELVDRGVWLVADGMGGHAAGDFASAAVVKGLFELKPARYLADMINDISDRIRETNRYLFEESARRGLGVIGATVAVLILFGRHTVCIWAGDSGEASDVA